MRIISGEFGGRRLLSPKNQDVRPTSDRVKEALFNILQTRIYKAEVLDLFCGSGGLGIEALSRGASRAVFVDVSGESADICKNNLKALSLPAEVYISDFRLFLQKYNDKFDIIFLDPPYEKGYGKLALEIISKRKLLKDGGVAVLEDTEFGANIEGLAKYDQRKYGVCRLSFYNACAE